MIGRQPVIANKAGLWGKNEAANLFETWQMISSLNQIFWREKVSFSLNICPFLNILEGKVISGLFLSPSIFFFIFLRIFWRKKLSAASHPVEPHASPASPLVQVSLKLAKKVLIRLVLPNKFLSSFSAHPVERCTLFQQVRHQLIVILSWPPFTPHPIKGGSSAPHTREGSPALARRHFLLLKLCVLSTDNNG